MSVTDSSQLTRPEDEGIVDVRAIKDVPRSTSEQQAGR
jgi:hypothetical protein